MAYIFRKHRYRTCPSTGKRVRVKLSNWYFRITIDRQTIERAGLPDRRATEQLAAREEKRLRLQQQGLLDPWQEAQDVPIQQHLDAFAAHLQLKGDSPRHIEQTTRRLARLFRQVGIHRLDQLTLPLAECWTQQAAAQGLSATTIRYYLGHLRQFCRWLRRTKRLAEDPLEGLLLPPLRQEQMRPVLDDEEVAWLLEATQDSPRSFRGLAGPDRQMLYLLALFTGLRAGELRALRRDGLHLDAQPPYLVVAPAYTKNRKQATLPLPDWLADQLAQYLADRQRGDRQAEPAEVLFPGTWHARAAEMLRRDLAEAGLPVEKEGVPLVFHSLRHTFVTSLVLAGVSPKVVQALARHSTAAFTLDRYAHVSLAELHQGVERLALRNPRPPQRPKRSPAWPIEVPPEKPLPDANPYETRPQPPRRENPEEPLRRKTPRRATNQATQE